jgi:outer membrane protein OmpA-like peptidoglycan-associated protein
MSNRSTALVLVVAGLTGIAASDQTPANPTQQQTTTSEDPVPVFRATVTRRSTPAINYRPRRGSREIELKGTALLPGSRAAAKVEGQRGYFKIDAKFKDLDPAQRFGREYLTYVLWAITPEGRATNLGEVQLDDKDGRVEVTTELQVFGLIVTAEPYFAVSQPSDVVVLENVAHPNRDTKVEVIQASYQLLKRGTYLMNQDAAQIKVTTLESGAPLDLAEARNAVLLAGFAGADRYASEAYAKAGRLLAEAEAARKRRGRNQAVMMTARQAVQTAEDARLIALRKREQEYIAEQRALAERREAAAVARARFEEMLRKQAEAEKEQIVRQAEAEKEALRHQAAIEKANAEAARLEAERERLAADAVRLAAEQGKAAAEEARVAAEAARVAAEAHAAEVRASAEQARRERGELRERLREELGVILETRETARGLIVSLSDVLFDPASAELTHGAREKLAKLTGVLLSYPGLRVAVEGHSDSVGPASYNQTLSERRALSVRDYLVKQGIDPSAVATSGLGEGQPVVSNTTAIGRQQNRRVELIVSGEAIKTNTTMTFPPKQP